MIYKLPQLIDRKYYVSITRLLEFLNFYLNPTNSIEITLFENSSERELNELDTGTNGIYPDRIIVHFNGDNMSQQTSLLKAVLIAVPKMLSINIKDNYYKQLDYRIIEASLRKLIIETGNIADFIELIVSLHVKKYKYLHNHKKSNND